MAEKVRDLTADRSKATTDVPAGVAFVKPADDRDKLLAEIAELKTQLARTKAASGQHTAASPAAAFPAGPTRYWMVSLDHVHRGLTTPSPWFEQEKPDDPRARPIEAASEAQAKAHCPTDTVVWVNTKSHIYHFAGTHDYGATKQGTYMCETEAKAAGDRAAENEKHP